jgi:DNA-binding transcriptional LysR family regulator
MRATSMCMNAQPVEWSDLQLLVAVRTAGSMLGAATRLGLAASTVGRRITALERATGAAIVERGPYGIRLTPAGDALAGCGAEVELAIARALRELPRPGAALTGTIRISSGDGFADSIVAAVRTMTELHPRVRFELALDDRPVDLARHEADIAVRTVQQRESTLIYRKLGALAYGLYADERYLAARGQPRGLAELAGHAWVGFAPPLDRLAANRWLRARIVAPPVLVASTFAGLLAAARAGLGLAVIPVVSSAGLAAVFPQADVPALPVWLVVHRDARELPHVAEFTAVLRDELAARMP